MPDSFLRRVPSAVAFRTALDKEVLVPYEVRELRVQGHSQIRIPKAKTGAFQVSSRRLLVTHIIRQGIESLGILQIQKSKMPLRPNLPSRRGRLACLRLRLSRREMPEVWREL